MRRLTHPARPDWQAKVEALGFDFHSMHGQPYWQEQASYRFNAQQIDELEQASNDLHTLCLQAVEHIIERGRYDELAIPAAFIPLIEQSWRDEQRDIYGRFDLVYDGKNPPKMLEYNADTPTSLFEASVVQWYWLEDTHADDDQFNMIHEKLIDTWRAVGEQQGFGDAIYFASVQEAPEDLGTCEYMRDVCSQAGFQTLAIDMEEIGWNGAEFTDNNEFPIRRLFKLYPWEWLVEESFGKHLLGTDITLFEPPWKMLLSNKGILPILWELFPNHPNLLPSYRSAAPLGHAYVIKPLFGREGANVTIHNGEQRLSNPGDYGKEGFIYQAYQPLPVFDGHYPIIGSWIIGGESAGIGIREDNNPITHNLSRFVPHFFVD